MDYYIRNLTEEEQKLEITYTLQQSSQFSIFNYTWDGIDSLANGFKCRLTLGPLVSAKVPVIVQPLDPEIFEISNQEM